MFINPGELNKRIQIIRLEEVSQNNNGFPQTKETVKRSCWAKVTFQSGKEIQKENSEFSFAKVRFLIRYPATEISTDYFIRYKSHDYGIVYVNPYGDSGEYAEIWCEKSERQ